MTDRTKKALERIRQTWHFEVRELNPDEYRDVIDEISADLEAFLEAHALEEEERDKSFEPKS